MRLRGWVRGAQLRSCHAVGCDGHGLGGGVCRPGPRRGWGCGGEPQAAERARGGRWGASGEHGTGHAAAERRRMTHAILPLATMTMITTACAWAAGRCVRSHPIPSPPAASRTPPSAPRRPQASACTTNTQVLSRAAGNCCASSSNNSGEVSDTRHSPLEPRVVGGLQHRTLRVRQALVPGGRPGLVGAILCVELVPPT